MQYIASGTSRYLSVNVHTQPNAHQRVLQNKNIEKSTNFEISLLTQFTGLCVLVSEVRILGDAKFTRKPIAHQHVAFSQGARGTPDSTHSPKNVTHEKRLPLRAAKPRSAFTNSFWGLMFFFANDFGGRKCNA